MNNWKHLTFIITQQILYTKIKNQLKLNKTLKVNFLGFNIFQYTNGRSKRYKDNYDRDEFDLILNEADKLYEERKYDEAYNFLQKNEHFGHEIHWRLSRVLYNMSLDNNINKYQKICLINKALSILKNIPLDASNFNYYKWKAIILCSKYKYVNRLEKVQLLAVIQMCLLEAYILNPNDYVVPYMLGHLYFYLAKLTWFQKKVIKLFFVTSPTSNDEEAYYFLSKAEDIKPYQSGMKHIYILGIAAYNIRKYYYAQYYLNMVANMPILTEDDALIKTNARKSRKQQRNLVNHSW